MTTPLSDRRDIALAALAHPIRREILETLRYGPHAVHALCGGFEVSQQAVSKHLALMRDAGLIRQEKRGRENVYHLCLEPLADLREWLNAFWFERLHALKTLAENGECHNDNAT